MSWVDYLVNQKIGNNRLVEMSVVFEGVSHEPMGLECAGWLQRFRVGRTICSASTFSHCTRVFIVTKAPLAFP